MKPIHLTPIGCVAYHGETPVLALDHALLPALAGLEGFSHIQVLWWFDGCDNDACRSSLAAESPYVGGPAMLGTFATRSPARPNPLALSCARMLYLDLEHGEIGLDFIDANPGSPVLDIKPYTPSLDRVEKPAVPQWCAHWPMSREASGSFDWSTVFSFG